MMPKRIGIFGGTFSPIHNSHVKAAIDFIGEMKLDKLYIVPNALTHYKDTPSGVSAADRLAMVKLAFSKWEAYTDGLICVSDFEISRGEGSYTVDTLEHFAPLGELYMLVGSDKLTSMDRWHGAKRIFELAHIAVVGRGAADSGIGSIQEKITRYRDRYGARITLMNSRVPEVSSTEIRGRIAEGKSVSGLVPDGVLEYIKEKDLYR